MSRIFKSQFVNVDENNRVNIKSLTSVPTQSVGTEVKNDSLDKIIEVSTPEHESLSTEQASAIRESIIKKAECEAKAIIKKANDEAKVILEEAKEEAYKEAVSIKDEAYKTGYDDGINSGNEIASAIKEEAEDIKREALIYKDNTIDMIEPDMIDLIINILDKLFSSEVKINPKVISILIKQGLSESTLTDDILVRVSKEDFEFVLNSKEEIITSIDTMAAIDFVEDIRLKRSDCIIETEFGSIDCSLNTQYSELKNNLYYILKNR